MKNEDVGEGLVPSRYPKRKTARLKDFDYAQANTVFFITLCSLGKRQVFVRHDFIHNVINNAAFTKSIVGAGFMPAR